MAPALILTALAASLLVGLAAVVRMAGPAADGSGDISGVIRLPVPVTSTIVTLFALAAGVFLLDLFRRARSRRREEALAGLGPEPRASRPGFARSPRSSPSSTSSSSAISSGSAASRSPA